MKQVLIREEFVIDCACGIVQLLITELIVAFRPQHYSTCFYFIFCIFFSFGDLMPWTDTLAT